MTKHSLEEVKRKIQKGLEQGFSPSYVLHSLRRHGFEKKQLDLALDMLTNPQDYEDIKVDENGNKVEEPVVEEQPEEKLSEFDKVVHEKKKVHKKRKSKKQKSDDNEFLALVKDKLPLIGLIAFLCLLFFILGLISGKLITFS